LNRRAVAALLLIGVVVVFSDLAWRKRKWERDLRERSESIAHFVNVGVELRVVVEDVAGDELIEGAPRMRVVHRKRAGGWLDTELGRIIAPTAHHERTVWYCSTDQYPVIVHADELPLGIQVIGSEGAGKTSILAPWHYFRWLEHLGEHRLGGMTAPTRNRLAHFLRDVHKQYPRGWYTYTKRDQTLQLADGTGIQLVSMHQSSREEGSPLQGYNFSWLSADEMQDSTDRHADMEARGRSAKKRAWRGEQKKVYKQIRTASQKDAQAWRDYLALIASSGVYDTRKMLGVNSPFIGADHWERLRKVMSKRDYDRRVLALDVGLELAVFHGWDRKRNLVRVPDIGAIDVTPAITADYESYTRPGARFSIIVDHDPGVIFNTSIVKRLQMIAGVPTWVVCGELQTKQTTGRQHARALREYLQRNFGIERGRYVPVFDKLGHVVIDPTTGRQEQRFLPDPDSSKALVFCDPHGKGKTETDYDTVYGAFQKEGLDVFSPSRKQIKRRVRIDIVNRLLCDANEPPVTRLVIAADEQGQPVAPVLVDAFESLQKRPGDDDPEGHQEKDEHDKTHAPAALGYGLYVFEQEAITEETIRRAVAAARRLRI
jgi:hypothetical protein